MLVLIITNFLSIHLLTHIDLHECFIEGNFAQNHGTKCNVLDDLNHGRIVSGMMVQDFHQNS